MHRNCPVDLVLVRHGQSEGNLAQRVALSGDSPAVWTDAFRQRHNSMYRLTDAGRRQAQIAGSWISTNIGTRFDRYFTSEYVRAMETAATLNLPDARWATEIYLRERDRGVLANKTKAEREIENKDEITRKKRNEFYWQPIGGESIANLCIRVDRVIQQLSATSSGLKVIIVCHGGVIKAFRALLEQIRTSEYKQRHKIHNCEIVWYSRRNPKTGYVSSKYNWVRSVCPWNLNLSKSTNDWQEIKQFVFSNEDLLKTVESVSQMVNLPLSMSNDPTRDTWVLNQHDASSDCSDVPVDFEPRREDDADTDGSPRRYHRPLKYKLPSSSSLSLRKKFSLIKDESNQNLTTPSFTKSQSLGSGNLLSRGNINNNINNINNNSSIKQTIGTNYNNLENGEVFDLKNEEFGSWRDGAVGLLHCDTNDKIKEEIFKNSRRHKVDCTETQEDKSRIDSSFSVSPCEGHSGNENPSWPIDSKRSLSVGEDPVDGDGENMRRLVDTNLASQ